jgi:hypothetical protein
MRMLHPWNNIVKAQGKIYYCSGTETWQLLKLNKEILVAFPELKEKRSKFGYNMFFPQNLKKFKQLSNDVLSGKNPIPIMINLVKENSIKKIE